MLNGWTINGNKLLNNAGEQNNQFLILGVVLAVVWGILALMFSYYLMRFKNTPAKEKIYGKPMLWTTLGLGVVILLCWILILVFWKQPTKIFGDGDGQSAYGAIVSLVVIGFVCLAAVMLMMWFFLPYYGIAFDEEQILFMGEAIAYNKITKIIKDTKTGDVFVNYAQGKRTHKKQKFKSTSVFGQFILANAALTGNDISVEDELAYFKTMSQNDKLAEERHDAMVSQKIKEQSKKPVKPVTPAEKPAKSSAKKPTKKDDSKK